MKINCVVVTFNRLSLLKECLQALENQTYPIHRIVIVDNCSTDGTYEYLEGLKDAKYLIIHSKENIGGAGGFSLGLKNAVLEGCDYTWLMDDDTIPSPTALEELVKVASLDENVGFVCSQVNWKDGKPHAMNKASLVYKNGVQNKIERDGVLAIQCNLASFVSVMVNTKAVCRLGLPIKEFFIWCDDLEYTLRIAKSYTCFYAPKSIVCHKTTTNYSPSIDKAPVEMAWRFYYSIRNSCYIKRKQVNRLVFFFSVLNKYRVCMVRLNRRPTKEGRAQFIRSIRRGCLDGLFFNPDIEYLP